MADRIDEIRKQDSSHTHSKFYRCNIAILLDYIDELEYLLSHTSPVTTPLSSLEDED